MDIITEEKKSVKSATENSANTDELQSLIECLTKILVKWNANKNYIDAVVDAMRAAHLSADWARLIKKLDNCATFLAFSTCNGNTKLLRANLCKSRSCFLCAWRLSLKRKTEIFNLAKIIFTQHKSYRPLMITLTVPNCKACDLRETVQRLNKSFNKMIQRNFWKSAIKGCFKSIEVTYSKERGDYHPHIHALVVVSKKYFDKKYDLYIERDDLLAHWQDCYGDPSITQVDMRPVRKKRGEDKTIWGAVAEVCKYYTKPADVFEKKGDKLDVNVDVFLVLAKELARLHLVSYHGLFKELRISGEIPEPSENGEPDEQPCSGCPNCSEWFATWEKKKGSSKGSYKTKLVQV